MINTLNPSWTQQENRTAEEKEKEAKEREQIKQKAEAFDRLILDPGWAFVLSASADKVNAEIASVAKFEPWQKEEQLTVVVRWNAMRELLDYQQDYVKNSRLERDNVLELEKTQEVEVA